MLARIGLTFLTVYYAPFYVALRRGLFAAEGLEVRFEELGDGRLVLAGLERGELEFGLGGVMRSMVAFDRGRPEAPIHFARVNDRDGFFLVGRRPAFDWPDLLDHSLILFSEAPTPWYVLRGRLLELGFDPDRVAVSGERASPAAAAAFAAGEADFLEAPAHVVEALLRDGAGFVVREMASEVGPIPYSSYCARPDVFERQPELVSAFVRAHLAAQRWMRSVGGAEIWAAIRPSFPEADDDTYRRAVERYQRLAVWRSDASLPRAGYDRLADLLRRGGLISQIAPYELVVRDELTRAALAAEPTA